jgi:membrane associated rhomboid family serine protease
MLLNIAAFVYQTTNTVNWIRRRHPQYWPSQAIPIVLDAFLGSTVPGPFTLDFVHSSYLSSRQWHRLLTSGFLHGGMLHLFLNMDALRRLPSWLETGLGAPLYLTTFLVSIVTGNLLQMASAHDVLDRTLCLGASGGICGLYGLMFVCLTRMGNRTAASRVLRGMGMLFLYGLLVEGISNAGHMGGFAGGLLIGLLCGPSYQRSYSLRRKNSLEVDLSPRDYRSVMGYDKVPTDRGLVPLPVLWVTIVFALASQARFRTIPGLVVAGLLKPGSVSAQL